MKIKILIILIAFIIMIFLFKGFNIYEKILRIYYPDTYSEYVDKYSEKYNVEREWIFALIKAESNFKKDSISQSGAIGLMQLMEKTAIEVSNEIGIEEMDLNDVDINIELGTKYFANLVKYYNGNYNLAIAAYNAGIGTVARWIKEGIIKPDGTDIENIPYKETNNYVRKILKNYRMYKELYE